MGRPHAMMVPFSMQGHVIPMLDLAQILAKNNIKITFINVEFIHDRVVNSFLLEDDDDDEEKGRIHFVSVSDGLETGERYIPGKLTEAVYGVIPQKIEELVQKIELEEKEEKISCLIYDQFIGSIQEVAEKMGIGSAAFLPAAAALLVLGFEIPKLIEDGIIDNEGTPLQSKTVQFARTMPIMSPSDFVWHSLKIRTVQKLIFDIMRQNNKSIHSADWVICNSAHELEPGAFALAPQIVPVGPLLSSPNSSAHFPKPDSSDSLEWLDQRQACSVIYVAFGSSTMFEEAQFRELALGLERSNRAFLWVVRPNMVSGVEKQVFPEGFLERVLGRGRIVGWAPQREVLSHPSVACFVSHCGWNSIVESVSCGVPMLCWPYFADQFINRSYICDVWRVGVEFERDYSGNITLGEIERKIDIMFGDDGFKERALQLKEIVGSSAREGGKSYENLGNFISWISRTMA